MSRYSRPFRRRFGKQGHASVIQHQKQLTEMAKTQEDAGKAEESPFRLLDLPPELWLRICGPLVRASKPLNVCHQRARPILVRPPITRVCRVLREELLRTWYRNSFVYYDTNLSPSRLTGFLRRVPVECRGRRLKVYVKSRRGDTQTCLAAPLQLIGYGIEPCAGVRLGGKKVPDGAKTDTFKVVRRA
ncbi:hypothetical protein LTR49_010399 [Elasticomyces elasticus]|nr:hypothetical protein LTR49_010399 [Elasticomyces elasticus]